MTRNNSIDSNIPDYNRFQGMTFRDILDEIGRECPEREMILFQGNRMSYGEFYVKVRQMATALKKLGIKKNDRVAVLFPNCPEFFIVQQATLYIGGMIVLLSTRYREYELGYMLKHSGAKCLFTIGRYLKTDFVDIIERIKPDLPDLNFCFIIGDNIPPWGRSFEEAIELGKNVDENLLNDYIPKEEDYASILYTSGSTGLPKGVVMTHRSFIYGATQVAKRLRIRPYETTLMIVPCSHTVCAFIQFPNILMGRLKVVMMDTFEATEALKLYNEEKVSLIYGVPAMFYMMLEHPDFNKYDFKSSRAGYTGGAIIPDELTKNVWNKMHCRLVSVYGLSETGAATMNDVEDDISLVLGTVGRPLDGVEVKIADENRKPVPKGEVGEVALRGPILFSGYYKQPELTKAVFDDEGFFYTGDLGKFLDNGCLAIVGRKKEMIIRGGFNVYPVEVEEQIRTIKGVQNVAVIGLPDKVMGEKVVACVIKSPDSNLKEEDIINFCKRRLANYKVPSMVVFMDEFPVTAMGKIQKYKIVEMLEGKMQ